MGNSCCKKKDFNKAIATGEDLLQDIVFLKKMRVSNFSSVWLVQSKNSNTLRAVKIMSKINLCKRHLLDLPINEQLILSQLHHSYLVNFISAFQDQHSLYILLEYMPFGSLRDYLNLQGLLLEAQARFLTRCIFKALQYLHFKKVIHLDLKPQNILIDGAKHFRICDFNLSRCLSFKRKENKKMNFGTMGYRAPQILKKGQIDYMADYFSVGAILCEVLTGYKIPNISSFDETEVQLSLLKKNISPHGQSFILGLLEKKKEKRLGCIENIKEIWSHPWIAMSKKSMEEFERKEPGQSFVSEEYIEKLSVVLQSTSSGQSSSEEAEDFLLKSIYCREEKFQKLFANFQTLVSNS